MVRENVRVGNFASEKVYFYEKSYPFHNNPT